eukprot:4618772-Prorocentrum_lima.AAC.1
MEEYGQAGVLVILQHLKDNSLRILDDWILTTLLGRMIRRDIKGRQVIQEGQNNFLVMQGPLLDSIQ